RGRSWKSEERSDTPAAFRDRERVMRADRLVVAVGATGALGLILGMTEPALCYAPATHTAIGAIAVDRSDMDSVLKSRCRIGLGSALAINGQTVRFWVAIGSTREDFPGIRSLNHFHSPLKPWSNARGLPRQAALY